MSRPRSVGAAPAFSFPQPSSEPARPDSGLPPSEAATPPPVAAAKPGAGAKPCACGHGRQAHRHYRRGKDCALCSCARYRRGLLSRLFR